MYVLVVSGNMKRTCRSSPTPMIGLQTLFLMLYTTDVGNERSMRRLCLFVCMFYIERYLFEIDYSTIKIKFNISLVSVHCYINFSRN
jgi:hypothetical protein